MKNCVEQETTTDIRFGAISHPIFKSLFLQDMDIKERSDIADCYKWDLTHLYPDLEAWEEECSELVGKKDFLAPSATIQSYRGTLSDGSQKLLELLKFVTNLERRLTKLHTYSRLRHNEDLLHEKHKDAYERICLLHSEYEKETSWIQPEILELDTQTFEKYLNSPTLKEFALYLKKIYALKPYTLSTDQEALLSLAEKPLETARRAFALLNNADLSFPSVKSSAGETKPLSPASYSLYIQSKDRILRKNSFLNLHRGYQQFENTICELLSGQVQSQTFKAKARGYPSALHAALTPHHIDVTIYHNLIDTVLKRIDRLHHYVDLRKRILGLDKLHYYDLQVSLAPSFEKEYTYEEAKERILRSVAIMGREYQKVLEKGLSEQRWVDVFGNKNKRSGAYSSGCYDSLPYISMNFCKTLRDVFILTHEAGHSMHSHLSNERQPYQYSKYPIFLAEIASTFHEDLLFLDLMEQAESHLEKCYFLSQKISDICSTLFRQTQFAQFELKLHEMAEKQIPLTPTTLKKLYQQLSTDFYGPHLHADPEISVEFLRIPHFYYNFYVYQYATGISAASALVDKVRKEGSEAYMTFLSSGSSQYPLQLLKKAGVDMHSREPIEMLIDRFDHLVSELETELNHIDLN